ncbi:hypothetical protein [Methylobacter sp. BBA5.1]|jgi:hypothetical protein|uniref:hypothetical protein n=1 Tax=Methylobacter sp. BBA5.1 TaxID=1495064 RepID=UPI00055CB7F6|nr:hypothetical protein [Methylobacter sp. BBA5.1]
MSNINVYLRENLSAISSKRISIAPDIGEKKINNAAKSFGYSGNVSNIIALYDNTLLGSGKDGLLFTGEQVIYRASFSDPISITYNSIILAEYSETLTGNKKDKIEATVEITRQDGSKIIIKGLLDCDYRELAKVLQTAISEFDEYKEEKQLVPISEMNESLKIAYVKAIINMAFDNDDVIDDKEFAEILLLMTRLELNTESRFSLRAYMASTDKATPLEQLIAQIDAECPAGQIKSLHISLTKDMINLYFSTGGSSIQDFAFFQKNRHLIKVTDEEVDLTLMVIKNDHDMLKDDFTDDQIVDALKLISSKAAAVGTPLAAVYLSGSVVGMSAAGLTSGLASLGMGGMLGLSSMATGIGVAVLIGVGAYAGVRKLTGANELTRSKRRELMLNEVIKQTQITISLLIQDINFITVKLNELILTHGIQDAQIKKLMSLMSQMTGAGTVLTSKSNSAQSSATKLRCAQYLDESKLKSLTHEPTKIDLYHFIMSFYEERVFIEEKDGEAREIKKLVIKKNQSTKDLENLARAFEVVGYFKVADVLKGAATDVAGKAKDKLAGFFHDRKEEVY